MTVADVQHEIDQGVNLAQIIIYPSASLPPDRVTTALSQLPQTTSRMNGLVRQMLAYDLTPEAAARLKVVVTKFSSLTKTANKAFGTNEEVFDPSAPEPTLVESTDTIDQTAHAIADLRAQLVADAQAHDQAVQDAVSQANRTLTIIIVVTFLLAVGIGLLLSHRILVKVKRVVAVLRQASSGDLRGRVEATGGDEIAEIGGALNETLDATGRVITSIRTAATVLTEAASSSSVINDISAIQAGIASAVEEQTAVTSEIGRSATDVARKADSINASITTMAGVVGQTTDAMQSNRKDAERLVQTSHELQAAVDRFSTEGPST